MVGKIRVDIIGSCGLERVLNHDVSHDKKGNLISDA